MTREIEIGVPEFDSRFLLETRTERKAAKVLGPELRRAITAAFDRYRVRTLVLEDGRLTVDADISFIEPGEYPGVLGLLDRAARTMDRTKIKVRILGSERRALVDERGKTRCAYCHEGLTGDEDDLVACEQCATVLHGECWRTHGKCPILGCSGKNPERGRVRG